MPPYPKASRSLIEPTLAQVDLQRILFRVGQGPFRRFGEQTQGLSRGGSLNVDLELLPDLLDGQVDDLAVEIVAP